MSIENLIALKGRSDRNLTSSEILCLSWLPGSLMKILSKMNKLHVHVAWRHHFPIISLLEIFQTPKGTLHCSEWSDLAKIQTRPRFYACPCYLQV